MATNLKKALEIIASTSDSEAAKGKAFEKLTKIFLENDPLQNQLYSQVWSYEDWAKERPDYSSTDIGIDLVAKIRDEDGFCAIQCKFYGEKNAITKADLDSFISASASSDFTRLLLVDTSLVELGTHAESVIDNLDKQFLRLPFSDLDESRIDWLSYVNHGDVRLDRKKDPMDHQLHALDAAEEGLAQADRGKIIMACGTGKTYTSLMVAEKLAGEGKLVLYMVPSLALMSQTVRSWKNDCQKEFTAFSACSDQKVGQINSKSDQIQLKLSDLAFPATTKSDQIAENVAKADKSKMTVIFSTYQSLEVISRAQQQFGLPEFDLILCDEAHRTTGATLVDADESNFVKIHDNQHIAGKKRLYMTATPRVYGEQAKTKASEHEVTLASMDDPEMFGETFFFRGFGWAVENNLLTDYKVVVLAVDEGMVSKNAQQSLARGSELKLDDATKIIGCYKALAKHGMYQDSSLPNADPSPMRRALGFCQSIKLSKILEEEFSNIVDEYLENEELDEPEEQPDLAVNVRHVDGTFNAKQREECLSWLKDDVEENNCRILTNARCLSEGVDVPSLDAIMFLHPRKSQIDVVQSVGRVMRKDPAGVKKMGYVILPIAIPPNIPAEQALNDNERYKVVWQILNALRTHDERLDSTINRIKLGEDVSDKIQIVGVGNEEMDSVTSTVDDIKVSKTKPKANSVQEEQSSYFGDSEQEKSPKQEGEQMTFVLDELSQAIRAKIVDKCGTREYWEKWAGDIAKIAQTHVTRITSIVDQEGSTEKAHFEAFLEEIRDDLNPEISKEDGVEMLAQHLITKPVFDTLFSENQFTKENPVSKAMETVLGQLHQHNLGKESESLKSFYDSVQLRASGIVTAVGRQALVIELYDKFFGTAFPMLTQKLGIVYTPPEVVDFIIHSVNDVLQEEFGQTLGSEGVHIIDPFTGTGTFITRLLQSGLISKDQLERKYLNEIHANEIVLLAYYIAAVNIESVYQDLSSSEEYQSFNGIVLTDTFQLYEQERDMIANLLPDNSDRRTAQKQRDIDVVIGNPPYSAGQKSANDNAANISYENLDERIEKTYAESSSASNKQDLYDSYIRSIRWATDRIKDKGVIGFVSNAGWIEGNATDGLRKCLVEEFSKIYIFHLRGNQRTQGETSRKEGGKIFGSGSRSPISINILVRNPNSPDNGKIFFHDIGDYLDRNQKLTIVKNFKSIAGIFSENQWRILKPDENNDWVNQGEKDFSKYITVGNKKDKNCNQIFLNYALGINTNRDSWAYNRSFSKLSGNMSKMIKTYNDCVKEIKSFDNVTRDESVIKWSSSLESSFKKSQFGEFSHQNNRVAIYRPFESTHCYFDPMFVHRIGQMPKIFPKNDSKNKIICVAGIGNKQFSAFLSDKIVDLNALGGGAQCLPLKLFDKNEIEGGLFDNISTENEYSERDGISDEGFAHFQTAYLGKQFTKKDLFYYIYGILHSTEYKERFQNNLSKELPRIPPVPEFEDFMAFSEAGRKLGDLHVNYETVEPFNVDFKEGDFRLLMADKTPEQFYRVTKMKFGGKRGSEDKTTVIYNGNITMQNIPMEAYDYIVNGRPALEWVMERQVVKTDKKSGITNDANDYANETMNDPAYPLKLFQRVITVSLETMKIVNTLPPLGI